MKNNMDEAKATSIKVNDTFTLAGDLGKFVKGEKVKVISVKPSGADIEIVLSNGKDTDNFFIDRNDDFEELT
jgi:hypothetical protein